jgi:hypothetical protein
VIGQTPDGLAPAVGHDNLGRQQVDAGAKLRQFDGLPGPGGCRHEQAEADGRGEQSSHRTIHPE